MKKNSIPFSNSAITLYNRIHGVASGGRANITWQRRVITDCLYKEKLVSSEANGYTSRERQIVVCIPADTDYVSPAEWNALQTTSGKFTLSQGDIIVKGEIPTEIAGSVTPGVFMETYRTSGAATIQSVYDTGNSGGPLGHYKITATA